MLHRISFMGAFISVTYLCIQNSPRIRTTIGSMRSARGGQCNVFGGECNTMVVVLLLFVFNDVERLGAAASRMLERSMLCAAYQCVFMYL